MSEEPRLAAAVDWMLDEHTQGRLEAVVDVQRLDFRAMTEAARLDPATSFRGKILSGLDFGASDLAGFDFTDADLSNCDFSRAATDGAVFTGAELKGARGLYSKAVESPGRVCVYVLARDFGFAPNPFFGVCSLATCKPSLRASANVGDWIVGIQPIARGQVKLSYAMRIDDALRYDEYWADSRFEMKKPYLAGSLKRRFGDNIYHRHITGGWIQEDSHHSYADGVTNIENLQRDTKADRVLISYHFWYFGSAAVLIPEALAELNWPHPGHKWLPKETTGKLLAFLHGKAPPGCHGLPADWQR